MARLYAALAAGGAIDGVRILRPETVERMLAIEVDGEIDRTFDVPVRRGLGFELGGLTDRGGSGPGATSTAPPFGTAASAPRSAGAIATSTWRWPIITNGVRRDEAGAVARRDLSDAVRAAGRETSGRRRKPPILDFGLLGKGDCGNGRPPVGSMVSNHASRARRPPAWSLPNAPRPFP